MVFTFEYIVIYSNYGVIILYFNMIFHDVRLYPDYIGTQYLIINEGLCMIYDVPKTIDKSTRFSTVNQNK